MYHDVLWCIMMYYDVPWCIMMYYDVLWCNVLWCIEPLQLTCSSFYFYLEGFEANRLGGAFSQAPSAWPWLKQADSQHLSRPIIVSMATQGLRTHWFRSWVRFPVLEYHARESFACFDLSIPRCCHPFLEWWHPPFTVTMNRNIQAPQVSLSKQFFRWKSCRSTWLESYSCNSKYVCTLQLYNFTMQKIWQL